MTNAPACLCLLLAAFAAASTLAATPMVSNGFNHSLALRSDGTVVAWGSDQFGKLGLGKSVDSTSPIRVPGMTDVVSVAGGNGYSIAIRRGGDVWTWGRNDRGQIGDGGLTDQSTPFQVVAASGAIQACAGSSHTAVVKQDGTVWTWGGNDKGQLGSGTLSNSPHPARVPGLAGVVAVACGHEHTIALLQDGAVWTWGSNDQGALGTGDPIGVNRLQPVRIPALSNVKGIAAGQWIGAALKQDGTVWEWGYVFSTGAVRTTPVPSSGVVGAESIVANIFTIAAIGANRSIWWHWEAGRTPIMQTPVGSVLGVARGFAHTLVLTTDHSVYGLGANDSGQLGDGNRAFHAVFNEIPALRDFSIASVAAGYYHTLAVDPQGSLWAWGSDANGQLGRGGFVNQSVPATIPGLRNIVQVSAGADHSAALDQAGSVWVWGGNSNAQLGDGSLTGRSSPVRLQSISNIVSIAAGSSFTLALDRAGNVWSWGTNYAGQLGDGAFQMRFLPAQIAGLSDVISIAAGGHSLAVKRDGTVWAWGANDHGQLGFGSVTPLCCYLAPPHGRPAAVPSLSGVKEVKATMFNSYALKTDGSVWAWGDNRFGSVGDGTTDRRASPVAVRGLSDVTHISAGIFLALARRTDGSVWAWGQDTAGEIGSSTRTVRTLAASLKGIGNILGVAAGRFFSAMFSQEGWVYTGGRNEEGQMGDGTFAQHGSFVLVVDPQLRGFLNLYSDSTVTPPSQLSVPFFLNSTGVITESRVSVGAAVQYRASDVGSSGNVFVFAFAPATAVVGASNAKEAYLGIHARGSPKDATADTAGVLKVGFAKDETKADTPIPCVLAQLNASGQMVAVTSANLAAYLTGVLSAQGASVSILNGVPTGNVAGATFFVGYGQNGTTMINTGVNRAAVTIPGSLTCTPSAPQTGWWWNPFEDGRGFSIEKRGNNLFFAAFLYDISGRSTWYVSSGPVSLDGSLYNGDLFAASGGQTLDGPYVRFPTLASVGTMTMTFNSESTGTIVWPGGAVPIQRFNIVQNGLTAQPVAGTPESGWWWNESEAGRGFFMEWQNGTLDIAGYMYDDAGNPVWYITVGEIGGTASARSFSGNWWSYGNGMALHGPWRQHQQTSSNVAPLAITFTGSETALMTLPNGRTTSLRRHRF